MAAYADPNKPVQDDWFAQKRNSADLQYGLGWNQNEFDRKVAQGDPRSGYKGQNYWARADLVKQLAEQRNGFQTPYMQRGIMHSGIYQGNLAKFASAQAQALTRQREAFANQGAGFQMGADQLKLIRQRALDDISASQVAYAKSRALALQNAGYGTGG
jgi:hypothetical protein